MRGGIALIRKSLFSYMASRGFFWTLAVSWMMGPLVFMFAWIAAAGNGSAAGFTKSDFIFYYLALILVNQLTYPTSHWIIGENIQLGTMSTWLMRPLPVMYEAIASDIALKVVCMPVVFAVIVFFAVIQGFAVHFSFPLFLLFISSLIMSCMLRFLSGYALSLLAFWTQRIDSLLTINDTLIFLLAGQIAPASILPGIIGKISAILPFRYMLGFLVEILTGVLPIAEITRGLFIQAFWLIFYIIAQRIIYTRGIQKYEAIGG